MAYRGEYPPFNPQPITINDGQFVGVSNLGTMEASLAAIENNTDGLEGSLVTIGGKIKTAVIDFSVEDILMSMLQELKISNLYKQIQTDTEFSASDTT